MQDHAVEFSGDCTSHCAEYFVLANREGVVDEYWKAFRQVFNIVHGELED